MLYCVLSIASKLGKSEMFALSHLRLMKGDDTMITDGQHDLYVYNVSKERERERECYFSCYSTRICTSKPTNYSRCLM